MTKSGIPEVVQLPDAQRLRVDACVASISPADRKRAVYKLLNFGTKIGPDDLRALRALSPTERTARFDSWYIDDIKLVAAALDRPDFGKKIALGACIVLTRRFGR